MTSVHSGPYIAEDILELIRVEMPFEKTFSSIIKRDYQRESYKQVPPNSRTWSHMSALGLLNAIDQQVSTICMQSGAVICRLTTALGVGAESVIVSDWANSPAFCLKIKLTDNAGIKIIISWIPKKIYTAVSFCPRIWGERGWNHHRGRDVPRNPSTDPNPLYASKPKATGGRHAYDEKRMWHYFCSEGPLPLSEKKPIRNRYSLKLFHRAKFVIMRANSDHDSADKLASSAVFGKVSIPPTSSRD